MVWIAYKNRIFNTNLMEQIWVDEIVFIKDELKTVNYRICGVNENGECILFETGPFEFSDTEDKALKTLTYEVFEYIIENLHRNDTIKIHEYFKKKLSMRL